MSAPTYCNTSPYRGKDFELRGEKEVCEHFGIDRPAQIIDLLALMGDKIDNIPGCPGIGEKGAQRLIAEFGSVDEIIARSSELKGATKRRLKKTKTSSCSQRIWPPYVATCR